jgi:hypothetical protein
LRTRLFSYSATSATKRQTTGYGWRLPKPTTTVYAASSRTCDQFGYWEKLLRAGKSFRQMLRISRRRRCGPASASLPEILESARFRGRGGPQDREQRRRQDPPTKRRQSRSLRNAVPDRDEPTSLPRAPRALMAAQALVEKGQVLFPIERFYIMAAGAYVIGQSAAHWLVYGGPFLREECLFA